MHDFISVEGTVQLATVPARPECLLVIVPEGLVGRVSLPPLTAPFTREGVREALGPRGLVGVDKDRHLRTRVFDTVPGRWTEVMTKTRNEERSARAQQQKQSEMTQAAIMKGSSTPFIRDRAQAVLQKNEIDAQLAQLKVEFGRVRAEAACSGRYIDRDRYRAMEQRIERLKAESQALQTKLGELRREEKQHNIAESKSRGMGFYRAARELLDAATFTAIEEKALEDEV